MSGVNQAANLGGMLSQIGGAIGGMGSAGDALVNPLRRSFAPSVDTNTVAGLQQLSQYETGLGNVDAGRMYASQALAMEEKRRKADEKAKLEMYDRMKMGLIAAYQQTKDPARKAEIMKRAGALSQETGQDLMSGLYSVDAQERAQNSAEQSRQQFMWVKEARAREALDRQVRGQWAAADEDGKAKLVEQMNANGLSATAMALQDHDRRVTTWNQAQEDYKTSKAAEKMVPITANERTIIDSELNAVHETSPKLAEKWRAAIKSIEDDTELTNKMKRDRVNGIMRQAQGYNVNNASAEAAAARKAAEVDPKDLKMAPRYVWEPEDSPVRQAIDSLDLGVSYYFQDKSAQEVNDLIESVDREELVRIVGAYQYTYPQLSTGDAIKLAVDSLTGTKDTPEATPKDTPSNETVVNWGDL